jgi:hypothetical protein
VAGEVIDDRIDELRRTFESAAITRARQSLRREQTEDVAQVASNTTGR